jgi:hypothetical protein
MMTRIQRKITAELKLQRELRALQGCLDMLLASTINTSTPGDAL